MSEQKYRARIAPEKLEQLKARYPGLTDPQIQDLVNSMEIQPLAEEKPGASKELGVEPEVLKALKGIEAGEMSLEKALAFRIVRKELRELEREEDSETSFDREIERYKKMKEIFSPEPRSSANEAQVIDSIGRVGKDISADLKETLGEAVLPYLRNWQRSETAFRAFLMGMSENEFRVRFGLKQLTAKETLEALREAANPEEEGLKVKGKG